MVAASSVISESRIVSGGCDHPGDAIDAAGRTRGPPARQANVPRGPPPSVDSVDARSTYAASASCPPATRFVCDADVSDSASDCSARMNRLARLITSKRASSLPSKKFWE